ncbi:MAG: translation initiation factor IF-2 [Lachnospiraceae bacterium]
MRVLVRPQNRTSKGAGNNANNTSSNANTNNGNGKQSDGKQSNGQKNNGHKNQKSNGDGVKTGKDNKGAKDSKAENKSVVKPENKSGNKFETKPETKIEDTKVEEAKIPEKVVKTMEAPKKAEIPAQPKEAAEEAEKASAEKAAADAAAQAAAEKEAAEKAAQAEAERKRAQTLAAIEAARAIEKQAAQLAERRAVENGGKKPGKGGNRDNRDNRDGKSQSSDRRDSKRDKAQNSGERRDRRDNANNVTNSSNSGQNQPQNRNAGRDNRSDGNRDNRNGGNRDNRDFKKDRDMLEMRGFQNKDKDDIYNKNERGQQSSRRDRDKDKSSGMDSLSGMGKGDRKSMNKKEREEREKSKQQEERTGKQENTKNLGKKPIKKPVESPKEKPEEQIRTLTLPEQITISDFADMLKQPASAIVKKLFMAGQLVTINSEIDYDTAEGIAMDFNCICEKEVKVNVIEELLKDVEDPEESLVPRPPVVCVMGHVDHGKTSLLDKIRSSNVTAKEAGGITQHIGAYVVKCNGQNITFLDTPGHEAFTAMRMRGAQSTDIAILVVAADDGVMPQTIEAINHAKAAGVEIVVAINKIDKPSANIERVMKEMAEYELIPEDWGGQTIFVPVSAKTGEGIDTLLEMLLLVAEMRELRANPNRNARGLVIEAQLDKGRGPVATVLVQKGTLHVGDIVAAGGCYGKVRAMIDDKGRRVKEATPSVPVEILGLNEVPNAGEIFRGFDNDKEARSYAETFISEGRVKMLEDTKSKLTLDGLFSQIQAGNLKELNIIIKADVQGSVEAVKQSLLKLSNDEVVVKVIHGGVGAINESDVTLAAASNAIIIGFNTRPDPVAKAEAEHEGVDVRLYRVIYQAIEDVEAAMKGMLDPVFEEKVIGHGIIRSLFKASGVGMIAGTYVTDGVIQRGCNVRVTRAGEQIFDGPVASLKRFKDDVKEVKEGYECGIVLEKFNDLAEEDLFEAYKMVEVPR